jgi:integrase
MIQIKFSMMPYIKGSTGQVGIKVRWNQSKSEVSFFTNVWAEPDKWDSDLLRAKKGTTHYVRGMKFTYLEINEAIAEYRQEIESVFDKCALKNTVPTIDELLHFAHFKFENDQSGRLERARDFWCFMAFTSLRVSDLKRLKVVHVSDSRIDMFAKKTGEHLTIPLTEEARRILEKYKDEATPDGLVFDIQSSQKLNDAVKDAAKAAGLDRIITEVYYIGTERREDSNKFCDIISNHDARRTFVSCSLAMGIPPETVMKCTGHKSYNTMKPYIETATETAALEMEKWNKNQYRSKIINLLDDVDEAFLKSLLADIQQKLVKTG